MANLNTVVHPKGVKYAYRRVGRGQSSSRGKTSGRGGKGQTARAGHKIRPMWRDIIKKLPKRRGYGKNRGRTVNSERVRPVALPLGRLEKLESGTEVTPKSLVELGILRKEGGHMMPVKILAGEISKKLNFKGCEVSAGAKAAIEKAGGQVN